MVEEVGAGLQRAKGAGGGDMDSMALKGNYKGGSVQG